MKKISLLLIGFFILSIVSTPIAYAKTDKVKGDKAPAGWEKGDKTGWEGDTPPGIEKKDGWLPPGLTAKEKEEWKNGKPPGWKEANEPPGWDKMDKEKKKKWEKDVEDSKKKIKEKAKKQKGLSDEDMNSAANSLEKAARKGVPPIKAAKIIEKELEKGMKGRDIETSTRAIAYAVGKNVDFDELGVFVQEKLDKGLRGDNLSVEIYKEISKRHEERSKL